jgi:cell division transport system permease protein
MKRMTVLWKILAQNLNQAFCKTYKYVTKEAAKRTYRYYRWRFHDFLGENHCKTPMTFIKGDYVIKDSIAKIETGLRKTPWSQIVYDKQLVNLVNDNIKKVSMWILIISGFLAVIAVLLINSSLRLSFIPTDSS